LLIFIFILIFSVIAYAQNWDTWDEAITHAETVLVRWGDGIDEGHYTSWSYWYKYLQSGNTIYYY